MRPKERERRRHRRRHVLSAIAYISKSEANATGKNFLLLAFMMSLKRKTEEEVEGRLKLFMKTDHRSSLRWLVCVRV